MLGLNTGLGIGTDRASRFWLAAEYLLDGVGPAAIARYDLGLFAIPASLSSGDVAAASQAQLTNLRPCSFAEFHAFTCSGTTSRTRINAAGALVADGVVDQPRYDYTGGSRRILLENQSTNLLLNSATLSTQSATVTAVAHTLSFYGTGTVTLSGASTAGPLVGTGAGNRVSLTFTPTAGSLTLTVSGSVTNAQLEALAFASSYIPTEGSTVTRPIETARLSPLVGAILQRSAATVLVRVAGVRGADGRMVGAEGNSLIQTNTNEDRIGWWNGSQFLEYGAAVDVSQPFGAVAAFDGSGRALVANAGTVATDVAAAGGRTLVYLGRSSGGDYASGRYKSLVIWPFRAIDASLPAKAVA